MKKKNIINLIRYHVEKNDLAFRSEVYEIAKDFDSCGDGEIAEYIMGLMSTVNTFIPQINDLEASFMDKIDYNSDSLLLPDIITNDILGIVNAIEHNIGVNKFLFKGKPGTGKTEATKQVARILNRDLYMVNFSNIIDSKLGQTQKNISALLKEINASPNPKKMIILFDEIDALALDRTNSNDLREMGRVTSSLLKFLDSISDDVIIIATTNLFEYFDRAIVRRFDSIIDFDRYSGEDLLFIAEKVLDQFLAKVKLVNRDIRLFRKILKLYENVPNPGELKNIIKSAIAFSNIDDGNDYLRRLYYMVTNEKPSDLNKLQQQGFTVREIEVLTLISRSSVARALKGDSNE